MKGLLIVAAYLALGVAAVGTFGEIGFRLHEHYAPPYEQVRRETFETSRAYQEGTLLDLQNLEMAYASGTPEQKAMTRSIALHRMADVDVNILTPELQAWREQLRGAGQ